MGSHDHRLCEEDKLVLLPNTPGGPFPLALAMNFIYKLSGGAKVCESAHWELMDVPRAALCWGVLAVSGALMDALEATAVGSKRTLKQADGFVDLSQELHAAVEVASEAFGGIAAAESPSGSRESPELQEADDTETWDLPQLVATGDRPQPLASEENPAPKRLLTPVELVVRKARE